VGSVNAERTHFELSVQDMALAEALYPGWLESLLTRPVQELDNYEDMIRLLIEEKEAIRFLSRAVAGCQDSSKLPSVVSELGLAGGRPGTRTCRRLPAGEGVQWRVDRRRLRGGAEVVSG
jgi:hypothetical protein